MNASCSNCPYYMVPPGRDDDLGVCRRFPPTVFIFERPRPPGDSRPGALQHSQSEPPLMPANGLCGEHPDFHVSGAGATRQ